jgi:hypothetical protein
MKASTASRRMITWLALCGAACTGNVSGSSARQGSGGSTAATGNATGDNATKPGPTLPSGCLAPAPLRRLSNFEYENTLRDLFPGLKLGSPSHQLPGDVVNRELVFDDIAATQGISSAHADAYAKIAEQASLLATADAAFTGCDPETGTDSCFDAFLSRFGERAYRRPLLDAERTRIRGTFDKVKTGLGFRAAEQAAIERVLQSPQFLYRLELESAAPAAAGPSSRLSARELATRLSYLLLGSLPDSELLAAAQSGALNQPEGLQAETLRLLAQPRALGNFDHLLNQWLDLPAVEGANKDMLRYPRFSSDIAKAMAEETRTFVRRVLFDGQGHLRDLFSADYTFVNQSLAAYYALTPTPAGSSYERVVLPAGRAAGILSQGAFASLHASDKTTSPVKRGAFVRTRLLCDPLPPPPPNVPPAPSFTGKETSRELLAKHAAAPECQACHRLIDPIGLGFENLDAAGVWRDLDVNGAPVDASGAIIAGGELDGAFVGVAELGQKLAQSTKVQACVARQYFRFGFGREATEADHCTLDALTKSLSAQGDFRALALALVASDAFQYRTN